MNPKPIRQGNTELSVSDLVTGSILGDGAIDKNGELAIEHGINQKDYLMWKYNILKDICPSDPKITHRGKAIRLRTRTLFKDLREEWYGTGRKALPDDLTLNPQIIAIWYMDDGSWGGRNHKWQHNRMKLCTHCFNRKEHIRMIDMFKIFEIEAEYQREGKYLKLNIPARNGNAKKFADLISPYMFDAMKYKIPDFREFGSTVSYPKNVYGRDENGCFISGTKVQRLKRGLQAEARRR